MRFDSKSTEVSVAQTFAPGWRVRLLLATAVARAADVLLLDEPTNHLDSQVTGGSPGEEDVGC